MLIRDSLWLVGTIGRRKEHPANTRSNDSFGIIPPASPPIRGGIERRAVERRALPEPQPSSCQEKPPQNVPGRTQVVTTDAGGSSLECTRSTFSTPMWYSGHCRPIGGHRRGGGQNSQAAPIHSVCQEPDISPALFRTTYEEVGPACGHLGGPDSTTLWEDLVEPPYPRHTIGPRQASVPTGAYPAPPDTLPSPGRSLSSSPGRPRPFILSRVRRMVAAWMYGRSRPLDALPGDSSSHRLNPIVPWKSSSLQTVEGSRDSSLKQFSNSLSGPYMSSPTAKSLIDQLSLDGVCKPLGAQKHRQRCSPFPFLALSHPSPTRDDARVETNETGLTETVPCTMPRFYLRLRWCSRTPRMQDPTTKQGNDRSSIQSQSCPREVIGPMIVVGEAQPTDVYRGRYCGVENPAPVTEPEPIAQPKGLFYPRSIDSVQGPSSDSLSPPILPGSSMSVCRSRSSPAIIRMPAFDRPPPVPPLPLHTGHPQHAPRHVFRTPLSLYPPSIPIRLPNQPYLTCSSPIYASPHHTIVPPIIPPMQKPTPTPRKLPDVHQPKLTGVGSEPPPPSYRHVVGTAQTSAPLTQSPNPPYWARLSGPTANSFGDRQLLNGVCKSFDAAWERGIIVGDVDPFLL